MAVSPGVSPKFGTAGYPAPTGVPAGTGTTYASTTGYAPDRGSNVAQTTDPMFSG